MFLAGSSEHLALKRGRRSFDRSFGWRQGYETRQRRWHSRTLGRLQVCVPSCGCCSPLPNLGQWSKGGLTETGCLWHKTGLRCERLFVVLENVVFSRHNSTQELKTKMWNRTIPTCRVVWQTRLLWIPLKSARLDVIVHSCLCYCPSVSFHLDFTVATFREQMKLLSYRTENISVNVWKEISGKDLVVAHWPKKKTERCSSSLCFLKSYYYCENPPVHVPDCHRT